MGCNAILGALRTDVQEEKLLELEKAVEEMKNQK